MLGVTGQPQVFGPHLVFLGLLMKNSTYARRSRRFLCAKGLRNNALRTFPASALQNVQNSYLQPPRILSILPPSVVRTKSVCWGVIVNTLGFPKTGPFFWESQNKDYSVLGSIAVQGGFQNRFLVVSALPTSQAYSFIVSGLGSLVHHVPMSIN